MSSRLLLSRCLLGAGIALVLASIPLMVGIGPLFALVGVASLAVSVWLAPRRSRSDG